MFILRVFLVIVSAMLSTADFCSNNCQYADVGQTCPNIVQRGIPGHVKAMLVDIHNKYRSKVALGRETTGSQPPASNMKRMEWDNELENKAQGLANQCFYEHDCLECRVVSRFKFGQNIAKHNFEINENLGEELEKLIDQVWYSNEVPYVQRQQLSSYYRSPQKVGHYTQITWAESNKVGCGIIQYGVDDIIFVCNYGPAGNFNGEAVYKQGQACSQCDEGEYCSTDYPGLCEPSGAASSQIQPRVSQQTPSNPSSSQRQQQQRPQQQQQQQQRPQQQQQQQQQQPQQQRQLQLQQQQQQQHQQQQQQQQQRQQQQQQPQQQRQHTSRQVVFPAAEDGFTTQPRRTRTKKIDGNLVSQIDSFFNTPIRTKGEDNNLINSFSTIQTAASDFNKLNTRKIQPFESSNSLMEMFNKHFGTLYD